MAEREQEDKLLIKQYQRQRKNIKKNEVVQNNYLKYNLKLKIRHIRAALNVL